MDKLRRDGQTAVLYSPGYGAGWYTWNTEHGEALIFCPRLVLAVLKESGEDPEKVAEELFPKAYRSGIHNLKVEWIPIGQQFEINEYDGDESVMWKFPDDALVA